MHGQTLAYAVHTSPPHDLFYAITKNLFTMCAYNFVYRRDSGHKRFPSSYPEVQESSGLFFNKFVFVVVLNIGYIDNLKLLHLTLFLMNAQIHVIRFIWPLSSKKSMNRVWFSFCYL